MRDRYRDRSEKNRVQPDVMHATPTNNAREPQRQKKVVNCKLANAVHADQVKIAIETVSDFCNGLPTDADDI